MHSYVSATAYIVTASVRRDDGGEVQKLSHRLAIGASILEKRLRRSRWTLSAYDLLTSAIAAGVAIGTGLWLLYAGKPFGTAAQYAEAFVWGFGIDNTVRGFAAVMRKISP
jgi:hypothetical protein